MRRFFNKKLLIGTVALAAALGPTITKVAFTQASGEATRSAASSGAPGTDSVAENVRRSLQTIAQGDQQYTVLADTDHKEIQFVLSMANNLDVFKKAGYNHVVAESRVDFQTHADVLAAYANASAAEQNKAIRTYADYVEASFLSSSGEALTDIEKMRVRATASLILSAASEGMHYHAVEKEDANLLGMSDRLDRLHKAGKEFDAVMEKGIKGDAKYQADLAAISDDDFVAGYHLIEAEKAKMWENGGEKRDAYENLVSDRLAGDRTLNSDIQDVAGKEKTLVMYGSRHLDSACGLGGMLPNARIVTLVNGEAALQDQIAEIETSDGLKPFAILDVSTGKLVLGDTLHQAPISHQNARMCDEMYKSRRHIPGF